MVPAQREVRFRKDTGQYAHDHGVVGRDVTMKGALT